MTVIAIREIIEIIDDHEFGSECVICLYYQYYRIPPNKTMGSGFRWSTLVKTLHRDSIIDTASRAMV